MTNKQENAVAYNNLNVITTTQEL